MQIPLNMPQFKHQAVLFLVSSEFETRFYVLHGGSINMRGMVAFSLPEKIKAVHAGNESIDWTLKAHDFQQEFYQQSIAQMREIIAELRISQIHLFAPHHIAFRLLGLFSEAEKAMLENILLGEYIRMHPLGLAQELSPSRAKKTA